MLRRTCVLGFVIAGVRCLHNSMPFYAVRVGRKPGIYTKWDECSEQVTGFPQARYKKFPTKEEALDFVNEGGVKRVHTDSTDSSGDETGPSGKKKQKGGDADDSANSKAAGWSGEEFDDPDAPVVYTDGCCFMNGKHGAVGGIGVYWGHGHKNNVSEKLSGKPTNNRAEIHAAMTAVKQAKEMKAPNLVINTDSEFLINSVTKWFKGWKKRGWNKSNGDPVANKEDFQELDAALDGINVKWIHVRGHKGVPGNEAADKLANEGARKK